MTREEAKELLPIIQAFAEGKRIEFFDGKIWIELDEYGFNASSNDYRIISEPKYRPFESKEE